MKHGGVTQHQLILAVSTVPNRSFRSGIFKNRLRGFSSKNVLKEKTSI